MHLSEEEYQELQARLGRKPEKKKPKYGNYKARLIDPKTGKEIVFDSQKEAEYYFLLLDKEKRGEIQDLKRQVKITILPAFMDNAGNKYRETYYLADFTYNAIHYVNIGTETGYKKEKRLTYTIVDVKGGEATKTPVYKLKKKLLAYQGYIIKEV